MASLFPSPPPLHSPFTHTPIILNNRNLERPSTWLVNEAWGFTSLRVKFEQCLPAYQRLVLPVLACCRRSLQCWGDKRLIDYRLRLCRAPEISSAVPKRRKAREGRAVNRFSANHGWPVVLGPVDGRRNRPGLTRIGRPGMRSPRVSLNHFPYGLLTADFSAKEQSSKPPFGTKTAGSGPSIMPPSYDPRAQSVHLCLWGHPLWDRNLCQRVPQA